MASTRSGSVASSASCKATPCHQGPAPPRNYILDYTNQINSGQVLTCQNILRWYETVANRIVAGGYKQWHFDVEKANKPIQFIETFCKQSEGQNFGSPIQLELFQKAFIQTVFGFCDDDGFRQFLEALLEMGRKNGKTTMLSSLALYMLIGDHEGAPQIYMAATKEAQAKLCFNSATHMLNQSPALLKHLVKHKEDIYFPANFGYIMPVCSESNSLDGLNSHLVVIDELHAITDPGLYEVLKQSTSSRRQPLVCMITTAGRLREGIYDRIHDYATDVLKGTIEDDRFLPCMYSLDDRSEWTDPSKWIKANPGLGPIKLIDTYLAPLVKRAKVDSALRRTVLCKDFNIRETESEAWLDFDELNNTATFSMDEVRDSYAVGGADLSSTTDLTCATLLIRKGGINYVCQQYFIPEDVAEKKIKEDKVPYDVWRDQGWITFTPGAKVDYSYVTQWFVKMRDEHQIYPMSIGYDSWGSTYWVKEMEGKGFLMDPVIQGPRTESGPLKVMRADLGSKILNYNNNPVLKWCLSNASVKTDTNENIALVKGRNQKRRIDGAMSLMDAYVEQDRKDQDLRNMENWQDWKE